MHRQYVMPTYVPSLSLVRGEGVRVWDADGGVYLDFAAGVAVASVGHCHPRLVEAIRAQAGRLMHVSNLFYNELQPRLAEAISRRALGGRCFFCNSGAEANEGLIKLARRWGHGAGRFEVITLEGSFHGRTLATLTATGQEKVKVGFDPLPAGFVIVPRGDTGVVRAAISERTAALLVEVVQGEGGVQVLEPAYFRELRALSDEAGILLLLDEVQTGFGRTGAWFGYQPYGVLPDALSMAKGMGGGFPMGGITASPALSDILTAGSHASTFGGNPLACAAALAVIAIIEEEGLLERARILGERLRQGLRPLAETYDWIEGVRGVGLLNGLVLRRPAAGLAQHAREMGLLAIPTANTVLRLVPPLTIEAGDVDQAVAIITEACAREDSAPEEHHP
jgi:predicted acetylornithine/succinylornithine family transaminase